MFIKYGPGDKYETLGLSIFGIFILCIGLTVMSWRLVLSEITEWDRVRRRTSHINERISSAKRSSYKGSRIKRVPLSLNPPDIRRSLNANERLYVAERDNYTCRYCSKKLDAKDIQIDHVYPYSAGGETSVENSVVSCRRCNLKKGSRIGIWPNNVNGGNYEQG